jgi:hypothetical protein
MSLRTLVRTRRSATEKSKCELPLCVYSVTRALLHVRLPNATNSCCPGMARDPHVIVLDGNTGLPIAGPLADFSPFGRSAGGVHVAAADFTGDGQAEVAVGGQRDHQRLATAWKWNARTGYVS